MADDQLIYGFFDDHRFLSNFWPVPGGVWFEGLRYPSAEHAYQAGKTMDIMQRKAILRAPSALDAKNIGKHIVLRPDWEEQKVFHMEGVCRNKFKPGSRLGVKLLNTGTATLVEANNWGDRFWGKCRGTGKNHLGIILMEIRDDLRLGYYDNKKESA